ncbi:MAG: transketolase C-terminal domain-containing protein [Bacillota bacterium]
MTAKSIRQQFADTMLEVGLEDPNLVVLVGDIGHFALQPFAAACPGRYYNIGICEATIISMAAGLAKTGFVPVAHTIAPFFIERAFEQIKLDFCYQQLGGNLVTVGSAFDYPGLGCTHHCYNDFALLKTLQRTQIVYPGNPAEFDIIFRQSYRCDKLTLFRIPAHQHGQGFHAGEIQFGKGIKVTDGSNLTIVATGPQLDNAVAARDALSEMGWDAEILYIHTIRPLDSGLIRSSASKTRRILVIEEHVRSGGLGDDVLRATIDIPDIRYSFISIPDSFLTEYGSYEDHCERLGLTRNGILDKVRSDFGIRKGVELLAKSGS